MHKFVHIALHHALHVPARHTSIGLFLLLDMMLESRLAYSYSQGLHAHIVKAYFCSDDWKLLWSFRDPFYAHHPSFEVIKAMKPGQKVNLTTSHHTFPLS